MNLETENNLQHNQFENSGSSLVSVQFSSVYNLISSTGLTHFQCQIMFGGVCFLVFVALLQITSSAEFDIFQEHTRKTRQLGLGNILKPVTQTLSGCETPLGQRGRCLPMEKCVLRELDEDYVKNKGYLCALGTNGPVGVCCSNTISKPVEYREGMFANKNSANSKSGGDSGTEDNVAIDDVDDGLI